MRNRRKSLLLGAGILAISLQGLTTSLAAASAAPRFAGSPIVIGQEVCETGYLSTSDYYMVLGAQMAVKAINNSGGVLHHKLALNSVDTQCIATNEISDANQLIDQDHALAIIGGFQSAALQGVAPVLQSDNVLFVGGGTLVQNGSWGITTFPPNGNYGDSLVGYVKKFLPSTTSIGNISGNTPYGLSVQGDVDHSASAAGIKTVDTEISNSATDATATLQQVASAQVVYTNTSGPINLIIAQDAANLGWTKPLVLADSIADCVAANERYPHVLCMTNPAFANLKIVNHDQLASNVNTFRALYAKTGAPASAIGGAIAAWDQVQLLANAFKSAGTETISKVNAKLTTEKFTGVQGIYHFQPGDTFGLTGNPYVMAQPVADRLKLLWTPPSGY